MTQKADHNNYV